MRILSFVLLSGLAIQAGVIPKGLKKKPAEPSPLDKYLKSATASPSEVPPEPQPGSLWSPTARLNDFASDPRAGHVFDIVTIVVSENINAVAGGVSQTERASSANNSITSLFGVKSSTGALANLLNQSGDQKLNGTGTTSRTATLNATLTAHVVSMLPGGLMLIEGSKSMQINSEEQNISVRGVIRSADLTTTNTVASTQVADMEIRVNGKGVVGDAIRRPNALYRFLLGLLPF